MTERGDMVRLRLHGCSHRPKVSAMVTPKKGDQYRCGLCKRNRIVIGVVSTWSDAIGRCRSCSCRIENKKTAGKKAFLAAALRHANMRNHTIDVTHDGEVIVIKPQSFIATPLIDDLLLP